MAEMKLHETAIRILLGGGIGSGKSNAGRRFEELGAVVVEADRLGHEMLEPEGEAFATVSARWPSVVVDGRIDRAALARIVFTDPEQLVRLEALTHPLIVERISEIALGGEDLVVEIPLILDVPGEWAKVGIDAEEDMRLRRAVERGNTESDVLKRMASQPSRHDWLAWADEVIDNNGAIGEFESQIDVLWYRLRTADYGLQA